jgi:hypothetical protein
MSKPWNAVDGEQGNAIYGKAWAHATAYCCTVMLSPVTIAARRFISSATLIWDEKSIKYRHVECSDRDTE